MALAIGGKVAAIIGTDFVLKTATSTTGSIGSVFSYLTAYDQPRIQQVIDDLAEIDLEHTVRVIGELIKEYDDNQTNLSEPIKKALLGVNQILEKIDNELSIIREAIEYHETKYFNSWRSFNCKCNVETIKQHKNILDMRYNILINLLKISK
jgi:hypothetical protein